MDAFVSVFRITRSSRWAVEKIGKLFGHVTRLLTNRAREGQLTTARAEQISKYRRISIGNRSVRETIRD